LHLNCTWPRWQPNQVKQLCLYPFYTLNFKGKVLAFKVNDLFAQDHAPPQSVFDSRFRCCMTHCQQSLVFIGLISDKMNYRNGVTSYPSLRWRGATLRSGYELDEDCGQQVKMCHQSDERGAHSSLASGRIEPWVNRSRRERETSRRHWNTGRRHLERIDTRINWRKDRLKSEARDCSAGRVKIALSYFSSVQLDIPDLKNHNDRIKNEFMKSFR
jgi:hypothetical protein